VARFTAKVRLSSAFAEPDRRSKHIESMTFTLSACGTGCPLRGYWKPSGQIPMDLSGPREVSEVNHEPLPVEPFPGAGRVAVDRSGRGVSSLMNSIFFRSAGMHLLGVMSLT